MKTFVLVKNIENGYIYWSELFWNEKYSQYYLGNRYGSHTIFYAPTDNILDIIKAESWNNLDYSRTSLANYNGVFRWLSPEGTHHSCDYKSHGRYAVDILHSTECDLGELGYIKIGVVPFGNKNNIDDREIYYSYTEKIKICFHLNN